MKGLKRSLSVRLCVIAVILFPALSSFPQEVTVEAKLDTTRALIGDQVGLHFTLKGPAGMQFLWPRIPDTIFNSLQVIARGKPDTVFSDDKKSATISQKLVLTSFDSGFFKLPPIPFYYRIPPDTTTRVAETQLLLLDVQTLAVDTTKAIKPIKGPVKVRLTLAEMLPWILLALGVVAVITFIVYYISRRRKHAPVFNLITKTELKPHEIALAELEELKEKKIWQAGRYKEYHSLLTDILRKYIENRFGVRALESTTDEIIDGLREVLEIRGEQVDRLQKILVLADLVKFAKAIPLGGENEESLELGTRFVKETIPVASQPANETGEK